MRHDILLVLNNTPSSENLIDGVIGLFNIQKYTGAILEGISSAHLPKHFYTDNNHNYHFTRAEILEQLLGNNDAEFVTRFIEKCNQIQLKTSVFNDNNSLLEDFINDSLYHDLIVLDKRNIVNILSKTGTANLNQILPQIKCPLLLLDSNYSINNVILVYDGSKKSIQAIKTFIGLFEPIIMHINIVLFCVVNDNSSNNEEKLINYMKGAKPHFGIYRVYPEVYQRELLNIIKSTANPLLVTGTNQSEILNDINHYQKDSFFIKNPGSILLT